MARSSPPETRFSVPLNSDQSIILGSLRDKRGDSFGVGYFDYLRGNEGERPDVHLKDLIWTSEEDAKWSKSRIWRVVRSLYGVISIREASHTVYRAGQGEYIGNSWNYREIRAPKTVTGRSRYESFEVPTSNREAVKVALDTGEFEKIVQAEDIPVLVAIYSRTQALRDRYGNNFSPRFYEKEVANLTNKPISEMRESLERLEGLICRAELDASKALKLADPDNRDGDNGIRIKRQYRPRWFMPSARVPDVETFLDRYSDLLPKSVALGSQRNNTALPGVNSRWYRLTA